LAHRSCRRSVVDAIVVVRFAAAHPRKLDDNLYLIMYAG
jgi:hypothetical protein